MPAFQPGNRILFQGDSITHGGRGGDPNHFLGHGYQYIISAKYGAEYPDRKLVFLNRGVSGDTVAKLEARWKADALDLRPELLSILVGINDLNSGVSAQQYEAAYDRLLAETVAALPKVRLVLCEPFGLPVGHYKEARKWDSVKAELQQRRAVVAKLAAKYHAPAVHFQKVFDDACQRAPADYWIWDGFHPTYAGHQLMADEWSRTVGAYWDKHQK
jgi:lysophospholipase L1-like esterase